MSGLGNKVPWEENDDSKKGERSEGAEETGGVSALEECSARGE